MDYHMQSCTPVTKDSQDSCCQHVVSQAHNTVVTRLVPPPTVLRILLRISEVKRDSWLNMFDTIDNKPYK